LNETAAALIDLCAIIAFTGAFVSFAFMAVGGIQRYSRAGAGGTSTVSRFPLRVGVFLCFVAATFALSQILVTHERNRLLGLLIASTNPQLLINGERTSAQELMLAALRGVRPTSGHHSHPTKRISVEVRSSAGVIQLELGRDSTRPNEYWVLVPAYWVTSTLDVGRVESETLSSY
jgi:hypothetical protein